MLSDVKWADSRSYASDTENEPVEFYHRCLLNASEFDLLLGYFSSSALKVLSLGFATFISRGGNVRIIANEVLSVEDKEAIIRGERGDIKINHIDLNNITEIKKNLDRYGEHFFNCLSYLVFNNRISLKVIRPKKKRGIAHFKSGLFKDASNRVSFKASCNFTAYGLVENLEELEVFCDWEDQRSRKVCDNFEAYFNSLYRQENLNVDYLKTEDIITDIKKHFSPHTVEELLYEERELRRIVMSSISNPKLEGLLQEEIVGYEKETEPRIPIGRTIRDYQLEAYEAWVNNGCCGIFSMATGTGKTTTSLYCLYEEYKKTGSYNALIVVPTVVLVSQWYEECRKFNFRNIVQINSRSNWTEVLSFFQLHNRFKEDSVIIIVTYASFVRDEFQAHLKKLKRDTLFIADEAHNLGAPNTIKLLKGIELSKRIGLSATIVRQFDEGQNSVIDNFFKDCDPYVVNFSLERAIESNYLVNYRYFIHLVNLTEDELSHYAEISKKLRGYYDEETGKFSSSKTVQMLLMRRKNIIHKAQNKLLAFKSIMEEEFSKTGNLSHTLVYVPEGDENEFATNDQISDDDDVALINKYTSLVSNIDSSIFVRQFTGKTKDREVVLREFAEGRTHVLTAMKCLDEGVDVPQSRMAVFCSSTGNPRQFIQRRGRILRLYPGKNTATIHDLVIVPELSSTDSTYEMERNMLRSELKRVYEFSRTSLNPTMAMNCLKNILEHYELSLYNLN
jgi:superfamily II DNA or RNA helicase